MGLSVLICVLSFLLLGIGVPVYLAMGIGGFVLATVIGHIPIPAVADYFYTALTHWGMLAIPFFILAGNVMLNSGSSRRLLNFINSLFGRLPGSIAVAGVAGCTFFSALCGSGGAAVAAIGLIMIPAMLEAGYERDYAVGVITCSGSLGNLIPPSGYFILYGILVGESVAKLFMAGLIPGIMLATMIAITAMIMAWKRGIKGNQRYSWEERIKNGIIALPALFMPFIILVGIYGGIFTPTEAAAVACMYGIIIGAFIYRELTWKYLWKSLVDTVKITSMIFFLVAAAVLFGKMMTLSGIPQAVTNIVVGANLSAPLFMIFCIVLLIVLGLIADAVVIMYVAIPMVLPTLQQFGISTIQFGCIMVISLLIGQITPPFGTLLYTSTAIFKTPVNEVVRGSIPFLIVMFLMLVMVSFLPDLSLWLPKTMYGH